MIRKTKDKNVFDNKKTIFKVISQTKNISDLKNNIYNNKIGLNSKEANNFINKFGDNKIPEEKNKLLKDIIKEVFSPFNLLLFFISIFNLIRYIIEISYSSKSDSNTSEYLISSIIVFIMIVLSTTVSLMIEYQTNLINDELKNLIKNNANVIRNVEINSNITKESYSKLIKQMINIESKKICIGDLVHLSAGDVVLADIKILYEHHLLVNESSITGESDNIHKEVYNDNFDDLSYKNICYSGSSIVSGFAIGVVFQRLNDSLIADISKKNIEISKKRQSSFKTTLNTITKIILFMILSTVLLIFFINSLLNDPSNFSTWLNSLVFSIAIAVGLIPESLPVIISANLSRGSKNMANKKMLIKNSSTVQDIGLIDILCTDKTGTLTNNEILLNSHININGDNDDFVFKIAFYNSYFQTSLVNNSIDNGILKHTDLINDLDKIIKIDEIPFNFQRRILSVIVKNNKDKKIKFISKGAFEEILKITSKYLLNGEIFTINNEIKNKIINMVKNLNNMGQRIIAVGYKDIDNNQELFNIKDENNIILCGFLTFSDTPKKGVDKAIKLIEENGVKLKIISGDNKKVTSSICSKIGLKINNIMTGDELEKLNNEKLIEKIEETDAFVKISPLQKSTIVKSLQSKHKVGFLGDGINDAIALKQSDVAISVDNASEIAKASSDVILLEKNLQVIEDGLIQGKKTYINISKFIKITLVNKFSFMLIFFIASIWFRGNFLSPFQILLMDLLLDFVQMIFILDNVDTKYTKKFTKTNLKDYYYFTLFNGPFLVISTILNMVILQYVFNCVPNSNLTDPNTIAFHTAVFTQMSINSIILILILRTKKTIFNSDPTTGLMKILIIIMTLIFLIIPYFPDLNNWLGLNITKDSKFQVSWFGYWYLVLIIIIFFYIFLQEIAKTMYKKIFKLW